jgi:hypothetical protein
MERNSCSWREFSSILSMTCSGITYPSFLLMLGWSSMSVTSMMILFMCLHVLDSRVWCNVWCVWVAFFKTVWPKEPLGGHTSQSAWWIGCCYEHLRYSKKVLSFSSPWCSITNVLSMYWSLFTALSSQEAESHQNTATNPWLLSLFFVDL